MKVYEIRAPRGIECVVRAERNEPTPGHGQVLVRMRAASLNYRDLAVARGDYGRGVPSPVIPLSDGAGEVVALGQGVSRWKVGERVAGIFMQGWLAGRIDEGKAKTALGGAIDGMLAEYRALSEEGLVRVPEHLSFEEAAALPCAAVTAWHALQGLAAGETVLIQGTGGVSIFALQFAKLAGARVVATSSSDQKLERVRRIGADLLINYKTTPDWEKPAQGVDRVIEVGGAGTLGKSLRAVRMGGRVALIGVLTGKGEVDPQPVLMKSIRLQGIYVGSREMFEEMNRAISNAKMRPVVDRVFPFEEAQAAYRHLESGAHFGKVIIGF
ncbi:MAG: NAD(P)-dependent alcohol dehydrogenase [Acidobacteriota bacterium]|nr:NAD(P)-dependent alcohol dehydrogenase [Acidobacteriota bacterium]